MVTSETRTKPRNIRLLELAHDLVAVHVTDVNHPFWKIIDQQLKLTDSNDMRKMNAWVMFDTKGNRELSASKINAIRGSQGFYDGALNAHVIIEPS